MNKNWNFGAVEEGRGLGSASFEKCVEWAVERKPKSRLICSDSAVSPFVLWSGGQLFGLLHLENAGDLDGDGGEEIAFIMDWADWSSLNSCRLATLKKGRWRVAHVHDVHESDFWWSEGETPKPRPRYFLKSPMAAFFSKNTCSTAAKRFGGGSICRFLKSSAGGF